jgi:hypothetical protein
MVARGEFERLGVIVVWGHGWVVRLRGEGRPSRVECYFPADYIFRASWEVADLVKALEEPTASDKSGESIESDELVDSGRKTP